MVDRGARRLDVWTLSRQLDSRRYPRFMNVRHVLVVDPDPATYADAQTALAGMDVERATTLPTAL